MAQEYGRYFGMKVGVFRGGCLTGPQHCGRRAARLPLLPGQGGPHRDDLPDLRLQGQAGPRQHPLPRRPPGHPPVRRGPRPGEVYNLGGGRANSCSILEAAALVEELGGGRLKTEYVDETRRGDHICYITDLRKLKAHYPRLGRRDPAPGDRRRQIIESGRRAGRRSRRLRRPKPPEPSLTRYTADRPLILLTDYPPDARGGGAVILRSLLGPEERERVVWLTPVAPRTDAAGRTRVPAAARAGRGRARSASTDHPRASPGRRGPGDRPRAPRPGLLGRDARRGRGDRRPARLVTAGACRCTDRPRRPGLSPSPCGRGGTCRWSPGSRGTSPGPSGGRHRSTSSAGAWPSHYRRKYGIESTIVHRALRRPGRAGAGDYDKARHGLRVGVLGSTYSYGQLPILARAVEAAAKSWASGPGAGRRPGPRRAAPGRVRRVGSRSSRRATSTRPRPSPGSATASPST